MQVKFVHFLRDSTEEGSPDLLYQKFYALEQTKHYIFSTVVYYNTDFFQIINALNIVCFNVSFGSRPNQSRNDLLEFNWV